MTATRHEAIARAIEVFYGKRRASDITYGGLREKLDEAIASQGDKEVDRNTAAALLEEPPHRLLRLEKVKPPGSPFNSAKRSKATIRALVAWHDELVRLDKTEARTGKKWASNTTPVARHRAKLPWLVERKDGNTVIYGALISDAELQVLLAMRTASVAWMTVGDAVAHPNWNNQNDRLLWADGYASNTKLALEALMATVNTAVREQETARPVRAQEASRAGGL
jgi:hypothetical protein